MFVVCQYIDHKGNEKDKPNYNSVDMSEVELQDRRHNHTYDNGTRVWIEDGVSTVQSHPPHPFSPFQILNVELI